VYRQIPYFKSSCLALKKKSWLGPLSSPPRDVGYLPKLTILTSWGKWNLLALNEQTDPVGCTRRRQRRVSTIEGEIHKRATTATPKMPFLESCVYLVDTRQVRWGARQLSSPTGKKKGRGERYCIVLFELLAPSLEKLIREVLWEPGTFISTDDSHGKSDLGPILINISTLDNSR